MIYIMSAYVLLFISCAILFLALAGMVRFFSRYRPFLVKDLSCAHTLILMSAVVIVGSALSYFSLFLAAVGVFPVFLYFIVRRHGADWKTALSLYTVTVVISLLFISAVLQPFFSYVAQPFLVRDSSMEPALRNGELIVIDRLEHSFRRGDLVVWRYEEGSEAYYAHRVVGVPFDTIEMRDGILSINGEVYPETYATSRTSESVSRSLKDGEYFLLSDDRQKGWDSRHFGPVQKDAIVGVIAFK